MIEIYYRVQEKFALLEINVFLATSLIFHGRKSKAKEEIIFPL